MDVDTRDQRADFPEYAANLAEQPFVYLVSDSGKPGDGLAGETDAVRRPHCSVIAVDDRPSARRFFSMAAVSHDAIAHRIYTMVSRLQWRLAREIEL